MFKHLLTLHINITDIHFRIIYTVIITHLLMRSKHLGQNELHCNLPINIVFVGLYILFSLKDAELKRESEQAYQ